MAQSVRAASFFLMCFLGVLGVKAQTFPVSAATPHPLPEDRAILDDSQTRKDLPCSLDVVPPSLGFDLKLHTGYELSVPFHDVAGSSPAGVTVWFRVTPEKTPNASVFFQQHYDLPALENKAEGDLQVTGYVDMGEGRYHVDWLFRDDRQRVCSSHWDVKAELPKSDKALHAGLAPGVVLPPLSEPFEDQTRRPGGPLRVRILVNITPHGDNKPEIVDILRGIGREPSIGSFSLIAFDLHSQQVVYRQSAREKIDFPALGKAMHERPGGTIDVSDLAEKHGETDFLRDLLAEGVTELDRADATIFVGPKTYLDHDLSEDSLKDLGGAGYPLFYLNYEPNPYENPWRDSLDKAIRFLQGREYAVNRPRDLWRAWRDIMARLRTGGGKLSASAR